MAALLLSFCLTARAEYRHALLIGNGAYRDAALAAPAKDVRLVGEALKKRGFVVMVAENLDRKTTQPTIEAFAKAVPTRGTVLIYFSGYLLQAGKDEMLDTYLTPIDSEPHSLRHSKSRVRSILTYLQGFCGSATNIVILDGATTHPRKKKDAPQGLSALPAVPPGGHVIFPAPHGEDLQPAAETSPMARELAAGLNANKPLDTVIAELSTTSRSAVGDLSFLARPASRPASPPGSLRPGRKAGEEWVNDYGMIFCWIPAGSYTKGTPEGAPLRRRDEVQAKVTIDAGFWMAKYEFTRRQTKSISGSYTYLSTGDDRLHPLNKSRKDDAGKWFDVLRKTAPAGWEYSLPSEDEWEYAARAGTTTSFYFGDNLNDITQHANFADRNLYDHEDGFHVYADHERDDGFQFMAPVGSFLPNAWGLHDVYGNLSEHTSTMYQDPTAEKPHDPKHKDHVIRGGSYLSLPTYCRSAFRNYFSFNTNEGSRPNHVGYRFVIRQKK